MSDIITIGNAQGFWGDSPDAPARLVALPARSEEHRSSVAAAVESPVPDPLPIRRPRHDQPFTRRP